MSTALTVTVQETKGRLRFSRVLTLGSEYTIHWDGVAPDTENRLVLTNPCTDEILAQSDENDLIKLNGISLFNLFSDKKRPISIYAYAYSDSVVLGYGNVICNYTPLSFELGPDPELAVGLADAIYDHIHDTDNPHNVTFLQTGAAAALHTHSISDLPIFAPDGKEYRMMFKYTGGQLTFYFIEEESP